MPLTDREIKNLTPKEKPYKKSDMQGLYVLVKPNGKKYWRYDYSIYSKRKTMDNTSRTNENEGGTCSTPL